uniref:C2H2-type domain-containing protein n=1 Tax=Anopheles culicifacies TaxID=139723 RepID=A0A182MMX9_9DIPT
MKIVKWYHLAAPPTPTSRMVRYLRFTMLMQQLMPGDEKTARIISPTPKTGGDERPTLLHVTISMHQPIATRMDWERHSTRPRGRSWSAQHICHIMLQHSRVHQDQRSVKEFSCQHEGCHYLARSAADARRHLVSHSSERNFACGDDGCDYRGKSLAQLRRHDSNFNKNAPHCRIGKGLRRYSPPLRKMKVKKGASYVCHGRNIVKI